MREFASFEYLSEPREFSVEDIEGGRLQALIIAGIVNPFGPTLSFVATLGASESRPIIYAMLNPFQCKVLHIGTYTEGERWSPVEEFSVFSEYINGSCPTLLLLSRFLDVAVQRDIAQQFLHRFDDASQVIENVRMFYANPMDRVSVAMGLLAAPTSEPSDEIQKAQWSDLLLDKRHIWPEIQAFMYAWDGSINKSGISDELKENALGVDRMKELFVSMLPSVWIPDPEPTTKPPREEHPLAQPDSLSQVKQMLLDHDHWRRLRRDNLLEFLEWALLLYGREEDSSLVQDLAVLYKHVIENTDPEHRKLRLQSISLAAEKYKLAACTLLPPIVLDPDPFVVSTAVIDYIALSHPDENGLPFEFAEIDELFKNKSFENPGAVLGGLITTGDRRFHPAIHKWMNLTSVDGIKTATHCRTPFISHGEIIFWLDWSEELLRSNDALSEKLFGVVSSAVWLLGKNNPSNIVQDSERRYPAYSTERPVVVIKEWDRAAYAREIADRLYRCEAAEPAPKVFSAVLRAWNLEPKADLMDQFIPND